MQTKVLEPDVAKPQQRLSISSPSHWSLPALPYTSPPPAGLIFVIMASTFYLDSSWASSRRFSASGTTTCLFETGLAGPGGRDLLGEPFGVALAKWATEKKV